MKSLIMSRRNFLRSAAVCASCTAAGIHPAISLAQSPQGSGKGLLLVNLAGGNDGLNVVVPYTNPVYYSRRPNIAIPANQVLTMNGEVGLNPNLKTIFDSAYQAGNMAVVQQVGYNNADFSHFESGDIWSYGRRYVSATDKRGWLGRLCDLYFDSVYDVFGIGVNSRTDFETFDSKARPTVIQSLNNFGMEGEGNSWRAGKDSELADDIAALNVFGNSGEEGHHQQSVRRSIQSMYATMAQLEDVDNKIATKTTFPNSSLGGTLQSVAKLIQAGVGTQVFYTVAGGWDTHSNQRNNMDPNLAMVSAAINAFVAELKALGVFNNWTIVVFSEFGRNCFENGAEGTDHGHGNNMFVIGGGVKGGVYGPTPNTDDLQRSFLDYSVDFRSVFRSVVRDHLGLDPAPIFDEKIPKGDVELGIF